MNHPTFPPSGPACRKPLSRRLIGGLGCAALAAAAAFAPADALAGNADVTILVQHIPDNVSVGRAGLVTYAAYSVTITSNTPNVINGVTFNGSASVTGASVTPPASAPVATYLQSNPATACNPGATANAVQCNIGKLTGVGSPGSSASLVVLFTAPASTDGVSFDPDPNASQIVFDWTAKYSNGSDQSGSTPQSLACNGLLPPGTCFGNSKTGLTTTESDSILSSFLTYIPSFGGTFFTGNGASALPPVGTNFRPTALAKLAIPTGQNLSTAQATLTVAAGGQTSATTTTIDAVFTVPNTGDLPFTDFVTIELRRDASTIAKGAKIGNAVVSYSHDDNPDHGNPVQPCPANGDPSSFTPPVCEMLTLRTEFTKKTALIPDDIGDWLFVIHALKNGGFRF